MLETRVIPTLLVKGNGLVKTVQFKNPRYIGDPVNTAKLFNDKEVDELMVLDITATVERRGPNLRLIEEMANECFMPLGYGGGIADLETIGQILRLGIEKVVINSNALTDDNLVARAADKFGSQSIIYSMDVKKRLFGGYQVMTHSGTKALKGAPEECAMKMEKAGAGEILMVSIDKEGRMEGYDCELISSVARKVGVPLIACGGAGKMEDFEAALSAGASAVAAGSMFVYQGPHRAVLINYPSPASLKELWADKKKNGV
jgi:cyclase